MKALDLSENAKWKKRFRASSIHWATLAKNNTDRGLVCTDRDGIAQLYTWDVPTGNLKRITDQPTGVNIGWLSADGKYIFYLHDENGNEIGHYVRVPFDGGEAEDITPDMPPYASSAFGQSMNGLFRGFTVAGQDGFQIYIQPENDNRSVIYQYANLCFGPTFSADGSLAVVTSTERSGTLDTNLLVFESDTGDQIAELWDGKDSSISLGRFAPIEGDDRLLATTSVSGFNRPLVWNPRTGERKDLMIDDIPGDIDAWDWSPDATQVLLRHLHQAEYSLYVYHLQSDTVTKLNHPEGVLDAFFGSGFYADNDEIFVNWEDTVHPPRLIALDAKSGEQTRTVLKAGDSPGGPNMRSVTFESENGEMIQGWVATPDDGNGPYPTILHTHGGPTAVQKTTFAPRLLAWLDHGFAVMSVNYHGSTTFGKSFEKSIWGNLGDLEIGDMAAAYQWLVDNKIARPDEVLLTGGSYGGYLTLQAIGKRPELWAGGMASIAIADWKLMYEDQAETLRAYQHALFGGTPDETPEATQKSSPITYAENIRAPLLVIQGKNDTRCPSRQMEAYEAKLKQLGKLISIHWFEAGHGSLDQEQQIEHQELMLRFAYQILG